MTRHRRNNLRRRGLSLLEVVLALAILSGAFVALTQLVSTGLRAAANARDLTRAQIMAETVVSEIVAGLGHADSVVAVDSTTRYPPSLADLPQAECVQFERLGYFCRDSEDDRDDAPVLNRVVTLRDSWAKLEKQSG